MANPRFNAASHSFKRNGGRIRPGLLTLPTVLESGEIRPAVIVGTRERVLVRTHNGHQIETFAGEARDTSLLLSADAPPIVQRDLLMAGRGVKVGNRHLLVQPDQEAFLLRLITGHPHSVAEAVEEYNLRARQGQYPDQHGFIILDGEADILAESTREMRGAFHLGRPSYGERVATSPEEGAEKTALWSDRILQVPNGAVVYSVGPYGEMTRIICDGSIRQEDVTDPATVARVQQLFAEKRAKQAEHARAEQLRREAIKANKTEGT